MQKREASCWVPEQRADGEKTRSGSAAAFAPLRAVSRGCVPPTGQVLRPLPSAFSRCLSRHGAVPVCARARCAVLRSQHSRGSDSREEAWEEPVLRAGSLSRLVGCRDTSRPGSAVPVVRGSMVCCRAHLWLMVWLCSCPCLSLAKHARWGLAVFLLACRSPRAAW